MNELEIAILTRMAEQLPSLLPLIPTLEVTRRKLTGIGSYTQFGPHRLALSTSIENPLPLDDNISLPNLRYGLGALFLDENRIAFLEIFTYGEDFWSGECTGFSL